MDTAGPKRVPTAKRPRTQRLLEAPHLPTQFRLWGKSTSGPEKGARFTPLITNAYPQSPAPAPGGTECQDHSLARSPARPEAFGCSLSPIALCVPQVRPPGNPADKVATRSDPKHRGKEGLFKGSKQETGVGMLTLTPRCHYYQDGQAD